MIDQRGLWDHFQNENPRVFEPSLPRLRFLFGAAKRLVRGAEPRVLNVGIGSGWLERRCLAAGWRVASVDPSRRAAETLARAGVDAREGSIAALPFDSGAFEAVFCSEVLEHLDRSTMLAGLREVHRCLRPGGFLLGSVPLAENLAMSEVFCPHCGGRFHRWGHQQSFAPSDLRAVLAGSGFELRRTLRRAFVDLSRASFFAPVLALALQALLRSGALATDETLCFVAQRTAQPRADGSATGSG